MSSPPDSKLRLLRNRPLCIICGRPAEAEAIAKELGIIDNRLTGRQVEEIHDGHTFYLGSFDLQENLEYYITSSLRQGIQSFATHASILFHVLRPRYAIHAGVCTAYRDPSFGLKDVIFGEAAINCEEGKWENVQGEGLVFRPDYDIVRTPSGDMQAFADSRERPQYHYGDFISGSAVRQVILKQIRSNVSLTI
jgi:hypothetical protein